MMTNDLLPILVSVSILFGVVLVWYGRARNQAGLDESGGL
jgi:hypothetical protein